MASRRRNSAAIHLRRFDTALAAWLWPGSNVPGGSLDAVVDALRAWAAERPEDARDVQRLAVGLAVNCVHRAQLTAARRAVATGLDASMIGAPDGGEQLTSATWLALLGARLAYELDDVGGARVLVDRAHDTSDRVHSPGPLDRYLQAHSYLIEARLAEAALEVRQARAAYDASADLVATLVDELPSGGLLTPWSALLFGAAALAQPDASAQLLRDDLDEADVLATVGLARTSDNAGAARDAVDRCVEQGLPQSESVLFLSGVLDHVPATQIDGAADRLASAIDDLDERTRPSWQLALRALQADVWISRGDAQHADKAFQLARQPHQEAGPLALMIALASEARARYTAGDAAAGWAAAQLLLQLRAQTADRLAGSRLELRARAGCEQALSSALAAEAAVIGVGDEIEIRRRTAVLIDAMRSGDEVLAAAPPTDDPSRALDRAARLAADRFGRLAYRVHATDALGDMVVLVVQHIGNQAMFVIVGSGTDEAMVTTTASADAARALAGLAAAAERAITSPVADDRLVQLGRAAFDALPITVQGALRRASTVVIVPDFGSGRDRTPFELLHDGDAFLGTSKVVCRSLSLSHAMHVLEPPLVSTTMGRRALCVAVAAPPGMPALPDATTEVTRVGSALGWGWDPQNLLESDADPEVVLELAPLADVLHLACHGDSAAGSEALVLGDGKRLRALDIVTRHRLRGLTYLNACSLGAGRYVGGGQSRGVAYAFARAGSPTVVANLLPVADRSAADLAEAFYDEAREQPVGEALRRARQRLSDKVSAALWSTTILLGDPSRRLDGTRDVATDETGRLLAGEPTPTRQRLRSARAVARKEPGDIRLGAAIELATALADGDTRLELAARVAGELGHEIGEAQLLTTQADSLREGGDVASHARALRAAVAALEPLRGTWQPAYELHRRALDELRALDPDYQPRELESFKFESGLTVNDRTDPGVNAVLEFQEAQFEHERFWRGDPEFRIPDLDVASVAHNALVWGHRHRLYATGAESAYARSAAERLVWRGLVPESVCAHAHRIWAGLLYFLWGQQYVTHVQSWMLRAHTRVLEIATARVNEYWVAPESSPAFAFVTEIRSMLDSVDRPAQPESRFARARSALRNEGGAGTLGVGAVADRIRELVEGCRADDSYAAADLAAWVVGDVLDRERASSDAAESKQATALVMRTIRDKLADREEGWIMPYLMDGFANERETSGTDLLARWSSQVL
jgi:hypothetical protein